MEPKQKEHREGKAPVNAQEERKPEEQRQALPPMPQGGIDLTADSPPRQQTQFLQSPQQQQPESIKMLEGLTRDEKKA